MHVHHAFLINDNIILLSLLDLYKYKFTFSLSCMTLTNDEKNWKTGSSWLVEEYTDEDFCKVI